LLYNYLRNMIKLSTYCNWHTIPIFDMVLPYRCL